MRKRNKLFFAGLLVSVFLLFLGTQAVFAQSGDTLPDNWQLLDPQKDSVYGTSVNRAYQELLKGKEPHRVIVAVIDSGVDTAQVDLKGHIWTNPGEIPGNDMDDDHNGYVDDVHGWNFLGGKDGKSMVKASSELDREYWRLRPEYGSVTDSNNVKKKDRPEYRYWLKIKKARTQDSIKNKQDLATVSMGLARFDILDQMLRSRIRKDTLYLSDIQNFNTDNNDTLEMAKQIAVRVLGESDSRNSFEDFLSQGKEYLDGIRQNLDGLDKDPNALRKEIVGDDWNDIKDTHYGNNDVTGHFARHATHVAGIIAAIRNNGIGIDGITNHVLIMPVKVVPDGDERDKDVALGIRYAVDNGANIINMSFGKNYSPQKKWVDDAVKYAEEHDVLLVHAAGNDGSNDDSIPTYPNPFFLDGKRADNFITVGASSATDADGHLAATFSNYGKKHVDLFAPGVNIYSTLPDNAYGTMSGTSMATPVVSGIAALVLEYYPTLTAKQLRWVLDHSVTKLDTVKVIQPGSSSDVMVPFSSLCISGGIINAYNALKLAATLKGERDIKKDDRGLARDVELEHQLQ
ncbi:MAG: peptidase S8 [Chitinophagaceae bacterium]|nr:MAG: peptidase S8 [Chitinophagaceae bacterium]